MSVGKDRLWAARPVSLEVLEMSSVDMRKHMEDEMRLRMEGCDIDIQWQALVPDPWGRFPDEWKPGHAPWETEKRYPLYRIVGVEKPKAP